MQSIFRPCTRAGNAPFNACDDTVAKDLTDAWARFAKT